LISEREETKRERKEREREGEQRGRLLTDQDFP
jgi:hypothetical protein